MANENNNKEREKYSLNVTEFEPFNATKVVRVITTQNCSMSASSLHLQIIADASSSHFRMDRDYQ